MAHGEVAVPEPSSQTVSPWSAPSVGPVGATITGLDPHQLNLLDEVIGAAELMTGLRFSVYLGDLGSDSRASAESLVSALGDESPIAVLLAVSPGQRVVEIVTGEESARRISDRSARLAALSTIAAASEGDLIGALVNGVRTLADQAGTLPERVGW